MRAGVFYVQSDGGAERQTVWERATLGVGNASDIESWALSTSFRAASAAIRKWRIWSKCVKYYWRNEKGTGFEGGGKAAVSINLQRPRLSAQLDCRAESWTNYMLRCTARSSGLLDASGERVPNPTLFHQPV